MATLILPFSSHDTSLQRAGGKGANLAELARAGLNVPPGFIITTDAYHEFVEAYQLQPRILALAARAESSDPGTLDQASSEIRALFEQHSMPEAMAREIVAAYRDLNAARALAVAVRSSATAEDLPGLAFAGQQETYLNVLGERALLDAVIRCWSSLWTSRAIAYRARNSILSQEVALAVVVQAMIASESSGVLFTANPLTGRRDESVIDASFGLGEAIVSGQVDPDHYVVRSDDWKILERRLGEKSLAIVTLAEGGTAQIHQNADEQQALPDAQIVDLAQTGARIAEHFGSPQDIEWALAKGQLYILQSRPITSLYPVPANPYADPGVRVYASLNSIQGVTDPFTSLGSNVLQLLLGGAVGRLLQIDVKPSDMVPLAGDRLFIDITDLARDPRLRNVVTGMLERGDPGALAAFRHLVAENRIPLQPTLTRGRLLHLIPRVAPIARRILGALLFPQHGANEARASLAHVIEGERARLSVTRTLAERLQAVRTGIPEMFARVLTGGVPAIAPMMVGLAVVDRWVRNWLGERPDTVLWLMRGVPGNVTTEMDLVLWKIAVAIRADATSADTFRNQPAPALVDAFRRGALPPVAQSELSRFLDRYGMRAIAEIDVGRPRWREDPIPVISVLTGYLRLDDPAAAPDAVFERNRESAEALERELVARARQTHLGALRARMLSGMIRRMRLLGGLRELPKFTMVQVLDLYRTALLDSAQELVTRGALERADDIFFVPLASLERFAAGESIDLKSIVAAERSAYERERMRRQLPRLLLSTGEAFYEGVSETQAGKNDLIGDPVSPGVVEGRVQVVLDPRGARLEPGAILVCPATDPGWTPLFLTAGGLVMEIGGLVTHGSVVAREYGIPGVVGVHNATTRLKSGQRVRVDGNTGRVTILGDGTALQK